MTLHVILIEKQILRIWLPKQKGFQKSKYCAKNLNIFLRGHSITTWTGWQNFLHVVVDSIESNLEKSGILVNLGWISRQYLEQTFVVL